MGSLPSIAQTSPEPTPSLYIKKKEPAIAISLLTPQQQEARQKELLAHSIKRVVPPPEVWTLPAGHAIGQALQTWGEKAGWKVMWSMTKDWSIPASTTFTGDFQTAASDVIKTLAANGALIRAAFYEGNKTMVVTGPGVAAQ